ncbi:hypothetical protein [Stenotrophomonas sp. NA06056]|uniref:hypothetical protein n=1 Tax=Stenotrophomonas sp. NA06056 TaxID=2742129 RepID=UPI00158B935C|nr:hypothetical protein [Stenotrophomonas sp. NA06056]QKW56360.1 hypothetical protein HUT07_06905 [Stenotrophomonas sp. NA06056]
MHQFDPNENPFVDDLLRLLDSARGRFSQGHMRALARVYVSRLYGVDPAGFLQDLRGQSEAPVRCSIRVMLDGDDLSIREVGGWIRQEHVRDSPPDRTRLILVHVGTEGVTELFSGRRHVLRQQLRELAIRLGIESHRVLRSWIRHPALSAVLDLVADEEGRVVPLDGAAARDAYWRDDSDEDVGAWEHHEYDPPRADTDDGRGRHGGSGGGRGGDGEGPRGPDDRGEPASGRGGVMEVLDHPILFSADPLLLSNILGDL